MDGWEGAEEQTGSKAGRQPLEPRMPPPQGWALPTCFSCVSELTCTSQISQWNVLFCRPVFPLFAGPLPFTPALGKALIAPLPFRASSIVLCLVPARNVKKKKKERERRELLASNRLQDTMRQHHVMWCWVWVQGFRGFCFKHTHDTENRNHVLWWPRVTWLIGHASMSRVTNKHHEYRNKRKSPAAAAAKSPQSCPTLCDSIDGSPPGSPVSRIL